MRNDTEISIENRFHLLQATPQTFRKLRQKMRSLNHVDIGHCCKTFQFLPEIKCFKMEKNARRRFIPEIIIYKYLLLHYSEKPTLQKLFQKTEVKFETLSINMCLVILPSNI